MKKKAGFSLQTRMIVLITGLVLLLVGLTGMVSTRMISSILEDQLGKRVLGIAQAVANSPEVARRLVDGDPDGTLQHFAEKTRKNTEAQFVVIGNAKGVRFSHPMPAKIGQPMQGGDNYRALMLGQAYVSKAHGSLGRSMRGKTPVFGTAGTVVGVVSVGILEDEIRRKVDIYQQKIIGFAVVLLILGVLFAVILARGFKKAIFYLEPAEIGRLFRERNAILESIKEGVVAINRDGLITMINQAAIKTFDLAPDNNYVDSHVSEVLPQTGMLSVLESGQSQLDQVQLVANREIVVNRIPIFDQDEVVGVVSSFRLKGEIDVLAKELSRVQEYSDMLRQQTHEYSNKLYTISGLIQIEAYDKAIELIGSETSGYQDMIQFLVSAVTDSVLAGCILGKYHRARELNVMVEIDRDSHFSLIPDWIAREKLVTIISNLLDNAYQAVAHLPVEKRFVNLSLSDIGNDLIIEVGDAGRGVPVELMDKIVKKNFTTSSSAGKGMGLYLVKRALEELGGSMIVAESELGGALFTVYIPKTKATL